MDVLWEGGTRCGMRRGLTANYLRVCIRSSDIRPNTISRVKLIAMGKDEIIGEPA